eukprot:Selendium_serpulae@DN3149_c0_g1_i2.p1
MVVPEESVSNFFAQKEASQNNKWTAMMKTKANELRSYVVCVRIRTTRIKRRELAEYPHGSVPEFRVTVTPYYHEMLDEESFFLEMISTEWVQAVTTRKQQPNGPVIIEECPFHVDKIIVLPVEMVPKLDRLVSCVLATMLIWLSALTLKR